MFEGTKELRVVFFDYERFDPISNSRVVDFGMVDVMHNSWLLAINIVLVHQVQQVCTT
jgi:hypothetical protein